MSNRKNPNSRPARQPLVYGGPRPQTAPPQMRPQDLEPAEQEMFVRGTLIQRLGEYVNRLSESAGLIDAGLKCFDGAVDTELFNDDDIVPDFEELELLERARDSLLKRKALAAVNLATLVMETVKVSLPGEPTDALIRAEFRISPAPVDELMEGPGETLYDLKADLAEEALNEPSRIILP